jgi:hypothetical protein
MHLQVARSVLGMTPNTDFFFIKNLILLPMKHDSVTSMRFAKTVLTEILSFKYIVFCLFVCFSHKRKTTTSQPRNNNAQLMAMRKVADRMRAYARAHDVDRSSVASQSSSVATVVDSVGVRVSAARTSASASIVAGDIRSSPSKRVRTSFCSVVVLRTMFTFLLDPVPHVCD